MRNLDWIFGGVGSVCLAQTTVDVMTGTTPPWWAQFGVAIIVCIGVIYLMIRYLAPKLDSIEKQGVENAVTMKTIADTQNRIVTLFNQLKIKE
ncbi:MAG: hypothetical protein Q4D98_03485 [Planctomycetia bacterium]|nr:hypothetical protein [Planctomycetia bacterium]